MLFTDNTVIQVEPSSPRMEGKMSQANVQNHPLLGTQFKVHFLQVMNQ